MVKETESFFEEVLGSDLSVVVYPAPAGSADADGLALLAAIGLQDFS